MSYLTAVGIQQVSITIPSGATSATATITAVGSGAFIAFQGCYGSDSANLDDTMVRVELTNNTTVTAYRGVAGTSQTATANATVVDGDPTNLVKSVQTGTISLTISQTSNTASISAVTNSNAVAIYLGQTDTTPNTIYNRADTSVALSGSVVTAQKASSGNATTAGYCIPEFQPGVLNSAVQNVAYSATKNAASDTVAVTAVNTANTWLAYGGQRTANTTSPAQTFMYGQLTSGTVVTIAWNTSGNLPRAFNCCVAEFASGVLAQAVQRGTLSLASAASANATITSSSPATTLCNFLGNSSNLTTANTSLGRYTLTQPGATSITLQAFGAATGTASYEAIQFTASSGTALTIDLGAVSELLGTPRIDPPSRSEWLATPVNDNFARDEAQAAQRLDRPDAFEFLAAQPNDSQARSEFLATLLADTSARDEWLGTQVIDRPDPLEFVMTARTADSSCPSEVLITSRSDGPFPSETIGLQNSNGLLPGEVIGSLRTDASCPDEMPTGTATDRPTLTELLTGQRSDLPLPDESTGAVVVTTDILIPLEWIAALARDTDPGLETTGRIQTDSTGRAEILAALKTDSTFPDEGLAATATDPPVRLEALSGQRSTIPLPLENSGAIVVTADALLPPEWTGTLAVDEAIPEEVGAATSHVIGFPAELLTNQNGMSIAPAEVIRLQINNAGLADETPANLTAAVSLPSEIAAALAADSRALLELLAGAAGTAFQPLEFVAVSHRDDTVQAEFTATVRSEIPLPAEWLISAQIVTGNAPLPAEWLAEIALVLALPVEATNTPAPTPCGRILDPKSDNRILDPGADDRVLEAGANNRTINARARIRILKPNPSTRTL